MTNAVTNIDYDRLLWAAFFTPIGEHPDPRFAGEENWGAPILLIGEPGTAKTDKIYQLSRAIAAMLYSLKPGAQGEAAFGVTPVPHTVETPDGEKMMVLDYPPPWWLARFGAKPAILFLDEINTVGRSAQAPLLGAIQEKQIGSSFAGPRTRVWGAMNRTEEAAGGHDLAPPVANRLCHVPWEPPSVPKWNTHMINRSKRYSKKQEEAKTRQIDALKEEERVLKEWPAAYARAVGLITAFSEKFSDQWHQNMPKANDPKASGPWCSLRSKTNATLALASSYVHGLDADTRDAFMSGFVGEDFVTEFSEYASQLNIPNAADFLDGKVEFEHNPHRIDRTAALLNECAATLVPEDCKNRDKRAKAMFEFFDSISDTAIDAVASVVISSLHDAGFTQNAYAKNIVKRLRRMLDVSEAI